MVHLYHLPLLFIKPPSLFLNLFLFPYIQSPPNIKPLAVPLFWNLSRHQNHSHHVVVLLLLLLICCCICCQFSAHVPNLLLLLPPLSSQTLATTIKFCRHSNLVVAATPNLTFLSPLFIQLTMVFGCLTSKVLLYFVLSFIYIKNMVQCL